MAYAQQVQEPRRRAEAFGKLAPHLPPILLPQALEAARVIQDESHRADVFSEMIPQLKSSFFDFCFWKESLHVLAYRDRKKLLGDITQLGSVIIALGSKEALTQTARAIQEVGRQWP